MFSACPQLAAACAAVMVWLRLRAPAEEHPATSADARPGCSRDHGCRGVRLREVDDASVLGDGRHVDGAHRVADALALAERACPRASDVSNGVQVVGAHRLRSGADDRGRILSNRSRRRTNDQKQGNERDPHQHDDPPARL